MAMTESAMGPHSTDAGVVSDRGESWFSESAANTPLPSDPTVFVTELPNGLRVVARPNHYPANRVMAWLDLQAGAANEEEHERGIAHVLEHCVFVGTEAFEDQEQMRALFSRLGLSWSADANAYTDFRNTVYTLEGPWAASASASAASGSVKAPSGAAADSRFSDSFKEVLGSVDPDIASSNLPTLLHVLHQMAFRATFPLEACEKEKSAVLSEAQMRNTAEYRVECAAVAQVHAGE